MDNFSFIKEDSIVEQYEEFLGLLTFESKEIEAIKKAFEFAYLAHDGVMRKSGEPYISHPLAVARIVYKEIGLDVQSVKAALLHDVIEDTKYTLDDLSLTFSSGVVKIVDGLTKLANIKGSTKDIEAENFKKIFITITDDIRVVLVKLADRLHNMRTLSSMRDEKQISIAYQTSIIFVPLALKLGLHRIKTELEDLCLKYSSPKDYERVQKRLEDFKQTKADTISSSVLVSIENMLRRSGIEYRITSRIKSVYSTWRKMYIKNLAFEEIYDILALRIIVKATDKDRRKAICWEVYSMISSRYYSNPTRLRDWISRPKSNGYESLHLTIMGPEGKWIEVQIRTEEMDAVAERGGAAHWRYKTDKDLLKETPLDKEINKWATEIREALDLDNNANHFVDTVRLDLLTTSDIVVLSPKGERKTMTNGSTVIDFAYNIHSDIGNKLEGALVNGKDVPLGYTLKNGDVVNLVTSVRSHPIPEWYFMAFTNKSRRKILDVLKSDMVNPLENGIFIFEYELRKRNLTPNPSILKNVLHHYNIDNKDDFYIKLATGIIDITKLNTDIFTIDVTKLIKFWKFKTDLDNKIEAQYVIPSCCSLVNGEALVGVLKGNEIYVHSQSCPVPNKEAHLLQGTLTRVEWVTHRELSSLVNIEIRGNDRMGLLMDLTHIISSNMNINIKTIKIEAERGTFKGEIALYIFDNNIIKKLLKDINVLKGLKSVKRK